MRSAKSNKQNDKEKTMLDYKTMRAALKASPENVKLEHFTKAFYKTFCEAWKTKDWTSVLSTDFYVKEGFGYCVFLEVFTDSLPKWRLTFMKMDHGYPIDIGRTYIHEDTEELARKTGTEMLKNYGADRLEVVRVV